MSAVADGRREALLQSRKLTDIVSHGPAGAARRAGDEWLGAIEDGVLDISGLLPEGVEDYEARKLFEYLVELRRAAGDQRRTALVIRQMLDVLGRLSRRLEHAQLEDPQAAARFVIGALDGVRAEEAAKLLGVSTRTLSAWRAGGAVRNRVERLKLVAQIVAYLISGMTPTGVVMWFHTQADRLGGRTPLELIEADLAGSWGELLGYARGSRGQLAD